MRAAEAAWNFVGLINTMLIMANNDNNNDNNNHRHDKEGVKSPPSHHHNSSQIQREKEMSGRAKMMKGRISDPQASHLANSEKYDNFDVNVHDSHRVRGMRNRASTIPRMHGKGPRRGEMGLYSDHDVCEGSLQCPNPNPTLTNTLADPPDPNPNPRKEKGGSLTL